MTPIIKRTLWAQMEKNMASIDDMLNLPQRRILMPARNVIMDQHEQIINKFFDDFMGNRKNFIHSNTSYPKMDIFEDDMKPAVAAPTTKSYEDEKKKLDSKPETETPPEGETPVPPETTPPAPVMERKRRK